MSEENVEIARQAINAWNAGEMDRLRELYHPEAVYRTPRDWLGGPWVGREAVMEQFRELREVYSEASSFGDPQFLDAGDRILVQIPFRSETRGLALTTDVAWVYTISNGLIVSLEFFASRADALEAVGLEE